MLRIAVLFALGTLAFHRLAWLPAAGWVALELVLLPLLWRLPLSLWALLAGFAWSHLHALTAQPPPLAGDDGVMRVVATGRVVSLPARAPGRVRFVFEATRLEHAASAGTPPQRGTWRLRLSWHDPPGIHSGDLWRLPLRLRRAHGYASPGAWDYEGWLYWQGILYAGYVSRDGEPRRLAAGDCCLLNRLRDAIAGALDGLPLSTFARGVVRALTIGDRSALDQHDEALFRATGTSHLMAISGLHVGLVAGLGLLGVGAVWRRLPRLCARVPARVAGAAAGLVLAVGYAALAGFALPTQRALIMLAVFALGLLSRRDIDAVQALALALIGVLIWDPPSILSAGFWLSFGAVFAILATLRLGAGAPAWRQAVAVQLVLGLALWPTLTAFGLPASGVSPLANLILVPLFGFVVVPVSLLATLLLGLLPEPAAWLFSALGTVLDLCRLGLVPLAGLNGSLSGTAGGQAAVVAAVALAVGVLLSPPGLPVRWSALPLLVLPWLPREPDLVAGAFVLHLLDVGQGLSVVVETRRHTLVFDTGPRYRSGFSTAGAVIAPFLAVRGIGFIDRLVVSHGDSDHAGGVDDLRATVETGALASGEPGRVGPPATACTAGERWQWDGVHFEFLHPPPGSTWTGNNASCVLRIANAAGVALLTGDIEARVEARLARRLAGLGQSTLVVAPHHGSRSSSSAPLVAAARARYVLIPAGWANRYGFPARTVVERWREAGAAVLDTATQGTLGFHFGADGTVAGPTRHRLDARRFWTHRAGSADDPHAVSSAD